MRKLGWNARMVVAVALVVAVVAAVPAGPVAVESLVGAGRLMALGGCILCGGGGLAALYFGGGAALAGLLFTNAGFAAAVGCGGFCLAAVM